MIRRSGDAAVESAMPEAVRQALALLEAHPVESLFWAIAAVLYAQLMLGGPRTY
jgi:hypothetical protein